MDKEYPLVCHSITGYSGGGKGMIAQYEEKDKSGQLESPRQYAMDQNHKHLAEMTAVTELNFPPAIPLERDVAYVLDGLQHLLDLLVDYLGYFFR
jgi:N-acetyl-gamma-glutamyl-phosphate reductase